MGWFGKVKKEHQTSYKPLYEVVLWQKKTCILQTAYLPAIPRVGEKVHIPNHNSENNVSWCQCGKFYEVIQVYHFIEADGDGAKIIVVIDEPP